MGVPHTLEMMSLFMTVWTTGFNLVQVKFTFFFQCTRQAGLEAKAKFPPFPEKIIKKEVKLRTGNLKTLGSPSKLEQGISAGCQYRVQALPAN